MQRPVGRERLTASRCRPEALFPEARVRFVAEVVPALQRQLPAGKRRAQKVVRPVLYSGREPPAESEEGC